MKQFILLLVIIIGFSGISIATPVSFFESAPKNLPKINPAAIFFFFGFGLIWLAGLGRKKYRKK